MNDIQPITLPGIDPRRPLVIAGPCSAETEEQVLDTARSLAAEGIRICRAGLWKPRTKPGGFEGVGEAGIAWLQRVKRETGMYTSTEVATREHVATALKGGVDLLWIGARTAANPFAMQEIADAICKAATSAQTKNERPVSLALVRESIMRQPPEGYALNCEALAEAQAAPVEQLAMPVLLVTGDEDGVGTPAGTQALAGRLKDARPFVLQGCGHWTTYEKPFECARLLADFYKR